MFFAAVSATTDGDMTSKASAAKRKQTKKKVARKVSGPNFEFEFLHRAEGRVCVGVDEVGRGCLAGPVVTAAVVLPDFMLEQAGSLKKRAPAPNSKALVEAGAQAASLFEEQPWWHWINDSKLVAPPLRSMLSALILKHAKVQIAWCLPSEIDEYNILHASMIAMRRALGPFSGLATAVLVDGNMDPFSPKFRCRPGLASSLGFSHVELLVKGDSRSLSIAAASIVAKVYRDEWMTELGALFPDYSFAEHKGYSTPTHYAAIDRLGPCKLHRLSFAPFKSDKAGVGAKVANDRVDGKQIDQATALDLFSWKDGRGTGQAPA